MLTALSHSVQADAELNENWDKLIVALKQWLVREVVENKKAASKISTRQIEQIVAAVKKIPDLKEDKMLVR